jgi:alginate O-acetyltransferase complex protein AlgI
MTFDSLTFALFFAIFFPVYVWLRRWSHRKNWLLFGSCVFYGAWNPFFLLLLAFTVALDWWAALRIEAASTPKARKRWMIAAIAASASILFFFKYAQFFANSAISLFASIGIVYVPIDLGLILPLGISFYIFESISYIVDVYLKRVKPTRNLRDYALFMTFFPHLVAGPIMRYRDFGEQIATPRAVTAESVAFGAYLAVAGLFLKIVCADHVFAPLVNMVFAPEYVASAQAAWLAAFAFSFQLFCDFAGYTLTAIGVAKMLGFTLPPNFEAPFAAVGIADLWRRWHISLSSWMRDYIYIPLKGSRDKQSAYALFAAFLTFLISGLWHGAAWHFVVWGALHGGMLVIERMVAQTSVGAWSIWRKSGARLIFAFLTFTWFSIAVVFFRAHDVVFAWSRIRTMFGHAADTASAFVWQGEAKIALVGVVIGWFVHLALRHRSGWQWLSDVPWFWRGIALAVMALAIILSPGKTAAFIYFQF